MNAEEASASSIYIGTASERGRDGSRGHRQYERPKRCPHDGRSHTQREMYRWPEMETRGYV